MAKLLAFAGSNSSKSINHQLVAYLVSQINAVPVELIKLSDLQLVVYSEDEQIENGFPPSIALLYKHIKEVDGLLISVNEHNGNPSAFLKNMMDWLSRLDVKFLADKKIFLLSASPGQRGGSGSMEVMKVMLTRFGGTIIDTYSFPSFYENFAVEDKTISNHEMKAIVLDKLQLFVNNFQ
jgi:chromate reductase